LNKRFSVVMVVNRTTPHMQCQGFEVYNHIMKNEQMEPDFFLPSAAGRIVGVSATMIRTWISSGRLHAIRLSGGVRAVRRADLERFAAERAARATR
jgi:hypothetical protein